MNATLLFGDVLEHLRALPTESVQCVVTSPPYWGLRSYLPDSHPLKHLEIGHERTVHEFIDKLVLVFAEVHRVLKKDGVAWVNMGDCYSASGRGGNPNGPSSTLQGGLATQEASMSRRQTRSWRRDQADAGEVKHKAPGTGIKDKELVGQPWRLALALQDWGWYLRSDVIWHKPNPMPESVRDRPTKAHEYLFLLSKSRRYYYDAEALKEPCSPDTHARVARARNEGYAPPGQDPHQGLLAPRENTRKPVAGWASGAGDHSAAGHAQPKDDGDSRKLLRASPKYAAEKGAVDASVSARMGRGAGWRKAHLVGTGVGFGHGTDAEQRDRGRVKNNASFDAAMAVMPETRNARTVWTISTEGYKGAHFATFPTELARRCVVAGSRAGDTVLDPFMGSGTVALVALRNGRHAVGIDLDERNRAMQEDRLRGVTSGLPLRTAA